MDRGIRLTMCVCFSSVDVHTEDQILHSSLMLQEPVFSFLVLGLHTLALSVCTCACVRVCVCVCNSECINEWLIVVRR